MSHQQRTPSGLRLILWACDLPGMAPLLASAAWTSLLLWGPALSLVWAPALTRALTSCPTRVRVRYQKRQKLQFETKLGMNSPF